MPESHILVFKSHPAISPSLYLIADGHHFVSLHFSKLRILGPCPRISFLAVTGLAVKSNHHRMHDGFEVFPSALARISICIGVLLQPFQFIVHRSCQCRFVILGKLGLELVVVQTGPHRIRIPFEFISGFHLKFLSLILLPELFCLLHHLFDVLLRQAAFLVGDGDFVGLACRLVYGRDVQNSICIQIKRHLNLRHATRGWRNPI
mmetsp:Transcript_23919/g.63064  ORF Transcript_23919/g.63064 Transcript_23919/m.63064 type:complete len:205 (+) Transcript_23919:198-812(+)